MGRNSGGKKHLHTGDQTDPPSYDDLHAYLIEAVDMAAKLIRQQYIEIGVWPDILQHYMVRPQDVNKDGNTVEGLAWLVRKELGWPPKIKDPRKPQKEDADHAVLDLVTHEELLEVALKTSLGASEGGTVDISDGRVHISINGVRDYTNWRPVFANTEASKSDEPDQLT
ncbi:hypothetical protein SLS53_006269 [Cytospora paraplurivora]|uniref:Uncharacterized protein n=1 Tax=Cytospora paraplurivora TaxID=2898453 RepID=A0AAN9YF88_9PEZI